MTKHLPISQKTKHRHMSGLYQTLWDAGYYIIMKTCGLQRNETKKVEQKHMEPQLKTFLNT